MVNVLKQLRLDEKVLMRTDIYLPSHVFGVVSNAAAQITEQKEIALIASQVADSQVLHPKLYRQIQESKNIAQALNVIFSYQHLQASNFRIWIEYVDGELRICHKSSLKASNKNLQYAIEFSVFLLLRVLRRFYGRDWKPKYLAFQHQTQPKPAILKETLNNQVLYGAKCNYIPIEINPDQLPPFELKTSENNQDNLHQIKYIVDAFWDSELFGLDFVSHLFGVSERTIQRLFVQDDSSFRDYVNAKKIQKSTELLSEGFSITQIAEQLHYSDPTTFSRAMKKQLGMSPTQYMNTQLNSVATNNK